MKKAFRLFVVLALALIVHGFGSGTASAVYWCSSPDPRGHCDEELQCCREHCGPGSIWSCTDCKGLYLQCLSLGGGRG